MQGTMFTRNNVVHNIRKRCKMIERSLCYDKYLHTCDANSSFEVHFVFESGLERLVLAIVGKYLTEHFCPVAFLSFSFANIHCTHRLDFFNFH